MDLESAQTKNIKLKCMNRVSLLSVVKIGALATLFLYVFVFVFVFVSVFVSAFVCFFHIYLKTTSQSVATDVKVGESWQGWKPGQRKSLS